MKFLNQRLILMCITQTNKTFKIAVMHEVKYLLYILLFNCGGGGGVKTWKVPVSQMLDLAGNKLNKYGKRK